MPSMINDILIGVVSGIIATIITNFVGQWLSERKDIEYICFKINKFVGELDCPLSEKNISSVLEMRKLIFESFFQEVVPIASRFVFFRRKRDRFVNDLCEVRKVFYQKGVIFDIDWLKMQLMGIRDKI